MIPVVAATIETACGHSCGTVEFSNYHDYLLIKLRWEGMGFVVREIYSEDEYLDGIAFGMLDVQKED